MFKLTVVATVSARLFAPAPPPAVYSAPEAQMAPPMVMAPMVMPAAYATAEEGAGASWVLPSVAMLGIGGLFGYFATSKTSEGSELPMSRRDVLGAGAALAAFAPMAAFADGASSKAVKERSRQIYGSRVFRLSGASTEKVLEEQNVLTLFITGSYRNDDLPTQKKLKALTKSIVKAAKAGDSSATQAGLKEFIQVAKIKELDTVQGGNFNPTQRRNPGAPPTSEIEAQMGTQAFALYKPLKDGAPKAINK
jgi:hypothetical protein